MTQPGFKIIPPYCRLYNIHVQYTTVNVATAYCTVLNMCSCVMCVIALL